MDKHVKIPGINCIGGLTPTDILGLQQVPLLTNAKGCVSVPTFDGKKVMDFGAGISDFLNFLTDVSSLKTAVAVDMMYGTDEIYSAMVENTSNQIEQRISEVLIRLKEGAPLDVTTYQLNQLKRIKKILYATEHHKTGIRKAHQLEQLQGEVGTFDYIYVTHTFYYFSNKGEVLPILLQFLSPEGKLIITDYHPGASNGNETMVYLRELQQYGVPGITVLGIEDTSGDVCVEVTRESLDYFIR